MVVRCNACGARVTGITIEEWEKLFTENANLRCALIKLTHKYETETGKIYDLNEILTE